MTIRIRARFVQFVIETAVVFARAQVEAEGMIGVGDAASSLVGPAIYTESRLAVSEKLVDRLHALGTRVRLHICGKTRKLYEGLGARAATSSTWTG